MPLSFPASPTEGQTYSYGDGDWVFTSGAWVGVSPQGADRYGKTVGTAGEAIAARQGVILSRSSGKLMKPYLSAAGVTEGVNFSNSAGSVSDPCGNWGGTTGNVQVFGYTAGTELRLVVIRNISGRRVKTYASLPSASATTNTGAPGICYLGAENKWLVAHYSSASVVKARMIQVDPATGFVTFLSAVDVATSVGDGVHVTAAYNPTTSTAVFFNFHHSGNLFYARKVTYSGTVLSFGAVTQHTIANASNNDPGTNTLIHHTGRFTTLWFFSGTTRTYSWHVVVDTGGGVLSCPVPTWVALSLLNHGETTPDRAISGNKVLVAGTYNNGAGTAAVHFQPGYVGEAGGIVLRPVSVSEWNVYSPGALAGYTCNTTVAVVPILDVPGSFQAYYRDASGNYFTRVVAVADDLTFTVTAPKSYAPAESSVYRRHVVWTGYEKYSADANMFTLQGVTAPSGASGQELIGIAATSAAANDTLKVYTVGAIVPGYTGLTPGGMCYVHSGGNIDQVQSYDAVRIGRAVSATEILVTL